jgi:hypothetical protein
VLKNILCEVLLTIIVYAYDEMSYEVESREQLRGVRRLGFQTLGLNFGMLQRQRVGLVVDHFLHLLLFVATSVRLDAGR